MMRRLVLTDKELLAVDAVPELLKLKRWISKGHKLYPYISMLALRRAIAKAQVIKCQKVS